MTMSYCGEKDSCKFYTCLPLDSTIFFLAYRSAFHTFCWHAEAKWQYIGLTQLQPCGLDCGLDNSLDDHDLKARFSWNTNQSKPITLNEVCICIATWKHKRLMQFTCVVHDAPVTAGTKRVQPRWPTRYGLSGSHVSVSFCELFNAANDDFFQRVKTNSNHVLQPYLPQHTDWFRGIAHTHTHTHTRNFLIHSRMQIRSMLTLWRCAAKVIAPF